MPTSTDVINEALGYLRVREIGETPATDEVNEAALVFNELVGEWVARRVITADPANISAQNVQPMAKLLGNRMGPKYGRPYDADIDMREEARLREQQSQFTRRRGVGAVQL